MTLTIHIDPFPTNEALNGLWAAAWAGDATAVDFASILSRSLGHIGAYRDEALVGFVNIAWDGGKHAFILDTCVHPSMRRQGLGTRLVNAARALARDRGAQWLHVDFEPHLADFYRTCGFSPTAAGLIKLS